MGTGMKAMKRKERQSLAQGDFLTSTNPLISTHPNGDLYLTYRSVEDRMTVKVLRTDHIGCMRYKEKQLRRTSPP